MALFIHHFHPLFLSYVRQHIGQIAHLNLAKRLGCIRCQFMFNQTQKITAQCPRCHSQDVLPDSFSYSLNSELLKALSEQKRDTIPAWERSFFKELQTSFFQFCQVHKLRPISPQATNFPGNDEKTNLAIWLDINGVFFDLYFANNLEVKALAEHLLLKKPLDLDIVDPISQPYMMLEPLRQLNISLDALAVTLGCSVFDIIFLQAGLKRSDAFCNRLIALYEDESYPFFDGILRCEYRAILKRGTEPCDHLAVDDKGHALPLLFFKKPVQGRPFFAINVQLYEDTLMGKAKKFAVPLLDFNRIDNPHLAVAQFQQHLLNTLGLPRPATPF